MKSRLIPPPLAALGLALGLGLFVTPAGAQEIKGTVKSVDLKTRKVVIDQGGLHNDITVRLTEDVNVSGGEASNTGTLRLADLHKGDLVKITNAVYASGVSVVPKPPERGPLQEFWHNFTHNLFKPLLLFFYLGFLVPILRVKFEFPYVIYQGLTIYLLIAIGWHGGEELALLDPKVLGGVAGFMGIGFVTNFIIGIVAYGVLSLMTRMRRIDKATVAGYYGSDSAGTFVTCLGVLTATRIVYDAYMPVMLAVMEIPGCLVALYLVSRLRNAGMDPAGTMPDEPGYDPKAKPPPSLTHGDHGHGHGTSAVEEEKELALERMDEHPAEEGVPVAKKKGGLSPELLHEVFLNPGLFLLFGGILIGYISGLQGKDVVKPDDTFFVDLFQGVLCLFLLEMGMTASRKLKDLRTAGPGFIAFGLIMPNVFATVGILVAHTFSALSGVHLELGSYVLFSVLCAAASYIAVPAVQRLAIPEASPTLPLAASLGLTFSYNVTIGIPVYMEIAKAVQKAWPLVSPVAGG
jgi:hypothetical protein